MALTREQFVGRAMEEFESPLIGYAATILHDVDLARDVVQETFIRLCDQEPERLQGGLKSWLFTVCRNRAFDVLRKNSRTETLDEAGWRQVAGAGPQPDELAEHHECLRKIDQLLARLSDNQREVLLLKFQQGLSYDEIHEITGLTQGNIGFLIHTGLRKIREWLPDDLKSRLSNQSA